MSSPLLNPDHAVPSNRALDLRKARAVSAMLVLVLIFIVLGVAIHAAGILPVDKQVTAAVQRLRTPFTDLFFEAVTALGSGVALLLVSFASAAVLASLKQRRAAVLAVGAMLAYPANVFLKELAARVRPQSPLVQVIAPAGGYSFPSGHAMISLVVYGTVAYLFWAHLRSSRRRWFVWFSAVLVFLIGLSRVYLGVHWFSDVLGGWMAGSFLLLAIVELHRALVPVER